MFRKRTVYLNSCASFTLVSVSSTNQGISTNFLSIMDNNTALVLEDKKKLVLKPKAAQTPGPEGSNNLTSSEKY